jgi:predicted nucleic acid-binding protein
VSTETSVIPPIRDLDDIHVIQAAICGKADYLCTLDQHFYKDAVVTFCADRGITILNDVDLLNHLRQ